MLFAPGLAGGCCGLVVVPFIVLALHLGSSNSDNDAGDVAVLVALLALPTFFHPSSFLSWYWKDVGAPTPPPWTGSVGGRVARALYVRGVVCRVVWSVAVGKGGSKYGGGCRERARGIPGTMPMAQEM